MSKSAGWALIFAGALAGVIACIPWMVISLSPPRRYHYYYTAPGLTVRIYALLAVGVVLCLIGGYALISARAGADAD